MFWQVRYYYFMSYLKKSVLISIALIFIFFLYWIIAREVDSIPKYLSQDKDDFVLSVLNNSKLSDKYSDKVAEYIYYLDESVFHDNGSLESTSRYIINIFNKELFDLSELDINLNKVHSSLDSIYVRIIYGDGSYEEPNPKKVIREMPQYEGVGPLSNEVLYRFSLPQLKNNSSLEIITKCRRMRSFDTNMISSTVKVGGKYPTALWRWHLIYPVSFNLRYKLNHGNGHIKVKNDSQPGNLWFEAKNLPGIEEEINRPNDLEIVPNILLSNLYDFSEIITWHNRQLSDDHFEITPPISEIMDSLAQEHQGNRKALAERVYEWTLKNLKDHTGKLKAVGKQRNVMNVYKDGSLDCRDTASFLVALYRDLNFEAYEAWVNTQNISNMDRSFPMHTFDHAITVLKLDGNYIFLDATGHSQFGTLPYVERGRPTLILFPDGNYQLSTTPFMPPNENREEKRTVVTVNQNGSVSKTVEFIYSGEEAAKMRSLKRLTDKQLKDYIQKHYIVDKRKLVEFSLKGEESLASPLILSLSLEENALGPKDGRSFLVEDPGQHLFNKKIFDTKKRTYDLILGEQKTVKSAYNIKLPANLIIKKLPPKMNVNNDFFFLKRDVKYDPLTGEMDFTEVFERKINIVKNKDYKKFKEEYFKLVEKGLTQDWIVEPK